MPTPVGRQATFANLSSLLRGEQEAELAPPLRHEVDDEPPRSRAAQRACASSRSSADEDRRRVGRDAADRGRRQPARRPVGGDRRHDRDPRRERRHHLEEPLAFDRHRGALPRVSSRATNLVDEAEEVVVCDEAPLRRCRAASLRPRSSAWRSSGTSRPSRPSAILIESIPLFLPSTIPRSAPTSSAAYGSIAGGSWNCAATAPDSRVKSASPVTAFQGGSGVLRPLRDEARERASLRQVEPRRNAVERFERERDLDEVGVAGPLAHAVDRALHPASRQPGRPRSPQRCRDRSRRGRASARGRRGGRAPARRGTPRPRGSRSRACRRRRSRRRPPRRPPRTPGRRTRGRRATSRRRRTRRGSRARRRTRRRSRIRSSIVSRETPSASSLPSEIGLSITDARDAELDEHVDVGLHGAREPPHLGAQARPRRSARPHGSRRPRRGEPGLDPVDPRRVERLRDLELLLRREDDADRLLAVAQRRVVEADRRRAAAGRAPAR